MTRVSRHRKGSVFTSAARVARIRGAVYVLNFGLIFVLVLNSAILQTITVPQKGGASIRGHTIAIFKLISNSSVLNKGCRLFL